MQYHKSRKNTVVVPMDTAGTVWSSFVLQKPSIRSVAKPQKKLNTWVIQLQQLKFKFEKSAAISARIFETVLWKNVTFLM
jgi:hypothetical protein